MKTDHRRTIARTIGTALGTALVLVAAAGLARAQDPFGIGTTGEPDDPFAFSAKAMRVTIAPGATGELVVVAEVPPKHKLYRVFNDVPFEVAVEAPAGVTAGAAKLPKTKTIRDPDLEMDFEVFADGSEFVVPIAVAADAATGAHRVTVDLSYQGCDESVCFAPATRSVSFEVLVEGAPVEPAAPPGAATPDADDDRDPFRFRAEAPRIAAAPGATAELVVVATVPEGHHLYETALTGDPFRIVIEGAGIRGKPLRFPRTVSEHDANLGEDVLVFPDGSRFVIPVAIDPTTRGATRVTASIHYQGCSATACFPPTTRTLAFILDVEGAPIEGGGDEPGETGGGSTEASGGEGSAATDDPPAAPRNEWVEKLERFEKEYGLWLVYIICFGIGFTLCLTPCVFPMISLTSSVFGERGVDAASGKAVAGSPVPSALLYGLGVGVTFGVFGVIAGLAGSQLNLAAAFQNTWVLSGIIGVFVLLSLSMFGFYDLKPPSWVLDRYQGASEQGTYGAFFLMGVLGALVSAPCAGPPVLAAGAFFAPRGPIVAGSALFVIGLGLAFPFVLLGIASGSGKLMPNPGAWMEKVKKLFGIILLATAIYFGESLLGSSYPLVAGLFLLIVGVSAGAMDRLESGAPSFSRAQQSFAVLSLLFGVYLFGGYLLREGFIHPPVRLAVGGAGGGAAAGPTEIEFETDLEKGLARAKAEGKAVMVDFTATWCVYCKQIEGGAFGDPRVIAEIHERFVAIQVDVTTTTDATKKAWKTVGAGPQPPWLAFFDTKGTLLDSPKLGYQGGTIDADALLEILKSID